ncbi:protoglobin domain-containing protein [Marinobacterium sp. YM272]|uniref:protoglobin domain-containing protein n=1 Tax=Marinobacterium sp. YM272 TaxID=3421654 RepID=UPI003D7F7B80
MSQMDFANLCRHGKQYSGFDADDEQLLVAEGAKLLPYLSQVTEQFYAELQQIPAARPFLEGRLNALKATHKAWLDSVFTGPYNSDFAAYMHHVGDVHVKVRLPVEFMTSGTLLIQKHLIPVLADLYAGDPVMMGRMMKAVSAVTGFCLIIMQESYQTSLLARELEKFMAITGISRALFNNLASAYKDTPAIA